MIARLILILLLIFVAKKLILNHLFKFTSSSFIKGIIKGWYIIFLAIILLILGFGNIISNSFAFKTVIFIIISNLVVGVFEELLCRDVLFNKLLKYYNPYKAAILSSIFFAFAHIVNYYSTTSHIAVTAQIIYAFFMGVLFAAIYYFTQNIWSVMFLHGFIDLVSNLTANNDLPTDLNIDLTSIIIWEGVSTILVFPAFLIGKKYFKTNT